jgi:hypothetical protein
VLSWRDIFAKRGCEVVQYLMMPLHDPNQIGGVRPANEPGVTHIAIGLWVATLAVLALPSLGEHRHRIREEHLLKAYQIGTTTFGLL